jgi:hypothetical protein
MTLTNVPTPWLQALLADADVWSIFTLTFDRGKDGVVRNFSQV